MSKSSGYAPTPLVSRPSSPGPSDLGLGAPNSVAGEFSKDEDRQGLMMSDLGSQDGRERREKEAKEKENAPPTSREQGECCEMLLS